MAQIVKVFECSPEKLSSCRQWRALESLKASGYHGQGRAYKDAFGDGA